MPVALAQSFQGEVVSPVTALVNKDEPPEEEEEAPNARKRAARSFFPRARIARQRAVDAWTCASAL